MNTICLNRAAEQLTDVMKPFVGPLGGEGRRRGRGGRS